ncbi:unnamed protein product [Rotaria sordida]|uniref:Uncharacterized protein n=1 Tax=Rotaria sordida TaxID=392033 RepID=A0A813N7I8_9BILA|nr:unnamed protein product [Rotaria sordida]CAF0787966.1 unnamed protein product [Rotaria sordida]CAF3783296.1 unnamed protein product [Rotaria sordida]CAF4070811.1 unnamed protein product [Rotaria sordida]
MGNDKNFVESQDLPFRLIEIPIGSAPPALCSTNEKFHNYKKSYAPSIPLIRINGYDDAPSSLVPLPPKIPQPYNTQPFVHIPQRLHLYELNSKTYPIKVNNYRKKIHKPKLSCCLIS